MSDPTCLAMVESESVPEPLPADHPSFGLTPSSVLTMRFEIRAGTDATPEDVAAQAAEAFGRWREMRAQDGTPRGRMAEIAAERQAREA